MAITFDTADYEEIRKAIDTTLSENTLSDTVISSSLYEGAAIEVVEAAVASLDAGQQTTYSPRIKRAAKYLTASYVCPAVPALSNETIEGDQQSWQNRDLTKLAKELEGRAYDVIQRILTEAKGEPSPSDSSFAEGLFTTAKANAK